MASAESSGGGQSAGPNRSPSAALAASDDASAGEDSGSESSSEKSSCGGCSEATEDGEACGPCLDPIIPGVVTSDASPSGVGMLGCCPPAKFGVLKPKDASKRGGAAEAQHDERDNASVQPKDSLSSTYPAENLPPKTGISVVMQEAAPVFLRNCPTVPETFYTAPDTLFDDIVRLEADRISHPELVKNHIVYDSMEARVGESGTEGAEAHQQPGLREKLEPYYALKGPEDTTLVFESRFESGNLRRAVKAYEFEYDLLLNPDYNTKVHTQWYLFRVSNMRKGQSYRFNIINMVKPTSVYNEGMRPLLYSCKDAAEQGMGWVRGADNIAYYQNGIRRRERSMNGDKGPNYYTLTFSVVFKHENDTVYFTHCYPYTYTDLQKDLQELEADPAVSRLFRRRKLCDTLAGNACDLITITSFNSDPAALQQRRAVVITARVHPGESNASWIMKGMLDYLTGSSLDARILRDNFVFKIVPMLNPDGVIVGNYRCSLAGTDLNRQWDDPSRKMHPTIFFAKSMIRHLMNDRDVILYIDIHGHSRKKNVFMYGNSDGPGIKERIFPRLLSKSSDCFNFEDCCWKVQKSKESTARVVAYRELQITNSFTLEASFCGADFGALAEQHFTTRHLEEMGYMVCDAILDFCDPDQSKVTVTIKELQYLFPDDGNSDDVSDSDGDDDDKKRRRRRNKKKAKEKKKKSKASGKRDSGKHDVQSEREAQARIAQEQRDRVMQELIAEGLAVGDGSVPSRELTESERLRNEWRGSRMSRDSRERGWGSEAGQTSDTERVSVRRQLTTDTSDSRGKSSKSATKKKTHPQQSKEKQKKNDDGAPRGREPISAAAAIASAVANIASSASSTAHANEKGATGSQPSSAGGTQWTQKEKPRKGYDTVAAEAGSPVPAMEGAETKKQWHSESPRGHSGSRGSQGELASGEAPRSSGVFPPLSNGNARRAKPPEAARV